MPVTMKLELGGVLAPGKIATYQRLFNADVRAAVATGMKSGGRELLGQVRNVYASSVKIKKKSFLKAISIKLFDKKPDRLPDLWIGSRVPAIAAHAFGAHIPGPVLIPLLDNGNRIGTKKFALIVRDLIRAGNAEFRKVKGKTILFAEQDAANAKGLAVFRRAERARRGGKFRKQKGKALEVPIAVIVRNVNVKKSFSFNSAVQAGLPTITAAIQRELDRR